LSWHQLDDYHVDFQQDGSYLLNFRHLLPEQSRLELFMDYDPAFLSIDHFPGDANRGFEIPPAQAEFRVALDGTDVCHRILEQTYSNHNHASPVITLYSNSVLLLAPLPDMSMPFNVLSFTCTLYVFVIGSLVNLLVKKISAQMKATLQEGNNTDSKLKILLRKMRTKLQRLFPQKPSKPTTD
jgi:GPI-anchor transamidase subunit T